MPTPQSITLYLEQSANSRLTLARAHDQVPASGRIRAALHLWHTDPALKKTINDLAKQLRANRLAAGPTNDAQVKLSVSIGEAMREHLGVARSLDAVPASERIRAVLLLWDGDADVRDRINELARSNHATRQDTHSSSLPQLAAARPEVGGMP